MRTIIHTFKGRPSRPHYLLSAGGTAECSTVLFLSFWLKGALGENYDNNDECGLGLGVRDNNGSYTNMNDSLSC